MKKNYQTVVSVFTVHIILLLFTTTTTFAQTLTSKQKAENYLNTKGEVYFKFKAQSEQQFKELSSFLSLSHKKVNKTLLEVEVYANKKAFQKFLTYNIPFEVNVEDNEFYPHKDITARTDAWDTTWDAYPTYSEYVAKMQSFVTAYPTLCSLQSIGTTQNNREILVLKISDNVSIKEAEPEFLYTSTMHGNEIVGYPLMIRLIDYLLSNYTTDAEVAAIVNNTEIYINPLANPDGTYGATGSNIISNPTRANASGQDLNRNYPDNQNIGRINGGSGNTSRLHVNSISNNYEIETASFMKFEESRNFVLSANLHSGTELVNYPYDNTYSQHVDHDYYEYISVEYATNCQNASDALGNMTYMTVDEDSGTYPSAGVTHGATWYVVYGGRQDYMNYYRHAKEVTLELSNDKNLAANELPNHWEYNKQAFLDYMKQVNYGIQGKITDVSGNPIVAKVSIAGHDALNSWVTSFEEHGDYYRLIKAGTYNVIYEAPGYISQTISVTVTDNTKTVQDVTMVATTAMPTASNTEFCDSGSTMLSASGSGTLNWYSSATSDNILTTGTTYTTPTISTTTSYFVEDVITKSNVGNTTNNSNGGFLGGERYLVFDCTESVILSDVTVNPSQAGEMEVQLQDSSGNMLDSRVIIMESSGIQKISLDFIIPVANDLRLTAKELSSGLTLYRNNSSVNYPYTNGSISIKDSSAGTQYYYFYYDWEIEDFKSPRKEVIVTVNTSPAANYSADASATNGDVIFTNTSTDATSYLWDFGDSNTSTSPNPTHTYAASGNYNVTLTATNTECGNNVFSQMVNVTVSTLDTDNHTLNSDDISIYPNPTANSFYIKKPSNHRITTVTVHDLLGKQILNKEVTITNIPIEVNTSSLQSGVYLVHINTENTSIIKKIIIR